jgi:hypothetical protein
VRSSLCKNFLVVMKHSNLYLGLVLPSGGWQSLIGAKYEEKKFFLNRTLTGRCSIRNYDYFILFLIDKIWHFVKSSSFWAEIWRFWPKLDAMGQKLMVWVEIWCFRPDFDVLGQNFTFWAKILRLGPKFDVLGQNLTS